MMNDVLKQKGWCTNNDGAVSLFVVVFAALLMTIVTVSFTKLMISDQNQAVVSDLSQSAYDSAQAGVEDAKRLLLLNQACDNDTASASVDCSRIKNAIASTSNGETDCDVLSKAGIVGSSDGETIIQQNESDNASKLDQAYTCVKIVTRTDDYRGDIEVNTSDIFSLSGVSTFDRVEISWFSKDDISSYTSSPDIGFPSSGSDVSLPRVGAKWDYNYPALLRTQLIQTGSSFKVDDFNDSESGNRSNSNTLFLYPSSVGVVNKSFSLDARRDPSNTPQQIRCNSSFNDGEYACTATISLPNPITGNASQRGAYLRLSALYNNTSYKVRLKNGNTYVKLNSVQPQVDSTGRANDVFRRIMARIELKGDDDIVYPDAAIDIEGDLCKNFTVTEEESGYSGTSTCNP